MSERTEQGGPSEQGWSSAYDDAVSLTGGGTAPDERTQASPADGGDVRTPPVADGGVPAGGQGAAPQVAHPYAQAPYGPALDQQPDQPVEAAAGYGRPWPAGWPPPTNTKAIIALCTVFSMPVLGIVFGVMARREITRTGEGGRAYATWGLGLGIAAVVFWVLYLVAVIGFLVAAGVAGGLAGAGSGF